MDNQLPQALQRLLTETLRRARGEWERERRVGGSAVPACEGSAAGTPLVWGMDAWGTNGKTWGY